MKGSVQGCTPHVRDTFEVWRKLKMVSRHGGASSFEAGANTEWTVETLSWLLEVHLHGTKFTVPVPVAVCVMVMAVGGCVQHSELSYHSPGSFW